VLDTNVVLDWLVFADPGVAPIACAIETHAIALMTGGDCREELRRVLAHARLPLTLAERERALARYDALAVSFAGPAHNAPLPRCRDASDQKFLELARDSGAHWLVSKDRALLRLARRTQAAGLFGIVGVAEAGRLLAHAHETL
jgi:putative PIN family toxin of toxin-antitoxin system